MFPAEEDYQSDDSAITVIRHSNMPIDLLTIIISYTTPIIVIINMFDFKYGLDFKDPSISDLTFVVLSRYPVIPPMLALKYRDRDQYFLLFTSRIIDAFLKGTSKALCRSFKPFVEIMEAEQINDITTATYRLQFHVLMAIYFLRCECGSDGEQHLAKAAEIIQIYRERIRSGVFQMAHLVLLDVFRANYSV
ncbi:hypothetical protein M441DRAFT_43971 [Trichoderma asperellum CBS 433.97]|uniref:Uncharacterized protein n=1 Tax=Trichoderma asperellum (strain ATCC 204424 / CBS 433.97 / NBRC 101777) TaxID=1042311 RepID=A0A2T3ZG98_TRIA4|nr:hypothetical protein M441DRAFT_43971 [Trichoderma asperellum CBS 433.97]PTB43838.1 hypothetical protein M441DRAFT_43971 [Trichoderma asperellum CBS 433.97]